MKDSRIFLLVLASSAVLLGAGLAGCSGNGNNSGGAGGAGGPGSSSNNSSGSQMSSSSGPTPLPPALGAQIDRFGRPATNTALNHTFDPDPAKKGMAKDAYNVDKDTAKWPDNYGAEFAANLAILDSLDTICGNQLLAGPMPIKGRYDGLAASLADDRLWLKTDAAACTTYLAVELDATNVKKNMDCGGRKLDYDPIDVSYSALAIGMYSGVGDGVAADADTKGTVFPYLAAPH